MVKKTAPAKKPVAKKSAPVAAKKSAPVKKAAPVATKKKAAPAPAPVKKAPAKKVAAAPVAVKRKKVEAVTSGTVTISMVRTVEIECISVEAVDGGLMAQRKRPRSSKFFNAFFPDGSFLAQIGNTILVMANDEITSLPVNDISTDVVRGEDGYITITDTDGDESRVLIDASIIVTVESDAFDGDGTVATKPKRAAVEEDDEEVEDDDAEEADEDDDSEEDGDEDEDDAEDDAEEDGDADEDDADEDGEEEDDDAEESDDDDAEWE